MRLFPLVKLIAMAFGVDIKSLMTFKLTPVVAVKIIGPEPV